MESGLFSLFFSLFSFKLVPSQFSDFSLLFIYFQSADRAWLHAVAFFPPKTADPAERAVQILVCLDLLQRPLAGRLLTIAGPIVSWPYQGAL